MSADPRDLDARTSGAVRALMALEDAAPDELFETLPGATVPLWAGVRMRFAWSLAAEQTGSVDVATNDWSRWGEMKRLARGFLPSRWDAAARARHHPTLFYVGGQTLARSGSRARNWLVDDFATALGDTVIVQRTPLPTKLGAPEFSPTLSMEAGIARSRLRARGYSPDTATVKTIDRLLAFFSEALGVEGSAVAGIRARVLRTLAHQPHELAELRRVVERVRPCLVVMDTAAYTYNGETVGLFKDAGAHVAEPQHGWIGPSHAAYNYGRAFLDPRLKRALPDELLTFGSYWSESIRLPAAITPIGKPHLEAQAALAPAERGNTVIVISSRAEPDVADEFVVRLRAGLPATWRVLFRPHPAERGSVESRYPRLSAADGVIIDLEPDVYTALSRSRVVVGVASTVLFEADAFGCQVIVRDSSFAENIVGSTFGDRARSAEEVIDRIVALPPTESAATPDPNLWAHGAVEAFTRWADERSGRGAP